MSFFFSVGAPGPALSESVAPLGRQLDLRQSQALTAGTLRPGRHPRGDPEGHRETSEGRKRRPESRTPRRPENEGRTLRPRTGTSSGCRPDRVVTWRPRTSGHPVTPGPRRPEVGVDRERTSVCLRVDFVLLHRGPLLSLLLFTPRTSQGT